MVGEGVSKALINVFQTAVSSPKCNELMIVLLEVRGLGHEHLGGAEPVEGLAWSGIELPSDNDQMGQAQTESRAHPPAGCQFHPRYLLAIDVCR